MRIGNREFKNQGKTYLMGILNVTPDSFSDGGLYNETEAAVKRALEMVDQGAHIIDIGGESTRPGYEPVSPEEEISRVIPVIRALAQKSQVIISIDTYKAQVAEAALEAGAHMVNDIWGLRKDPDMGKVIARHKAAVCLMHNRSQDCYEDLLEDVKADLMESIHMALEAGIDSDSIMIDPGIGFGKNQEENLELIARVGELRDLGYPVLLAASRKSVIGNVLKEATDKRLEGTLAITTHAVWQGCSFIRVHDLEENRRALEMTEALMEYKGGK